MPRAASHKVLRTAFIFLCLLSVATVATADAAAEAGATPEGTPAPEAAAGAEGAAAAAAAEELPPLDCKGAELLEKLDTWSVDCVAMWLENLGFPELRGAFTGNKVDGASLKTLTMDKLAEDYGVSDTEQRKKIYYSLKDAIKKDSSSGNTNHYSQMLFWLLPFLGIYKCAPQRTARARRRASFRPPVHSAPQARLALIAYRPLVSQVAHAQVRQADRARHEALQEMAGGTQPAEAARARGLRRRHQRVDRGCQRRRGRRPPEGEEGEEAGGEEDAEEGQEGRLEPRVYWRVRAQGGVFVLWIILVGRTGRRDAMSSHDSCAFPGEAMAARACMMTNARSARELVRARVYILRRENKWR